MQWNWCSIEGWMKKRLLTQWNFLENFLENYEIFLREPISSKWTDENFRKLFFLREIEMGSDHIHLILKNGLATSNLKPTTFLKVNPLQVQLLTLSNFPEQLFYRTPQDHCFWCILKVKVTGSLSLRTHKK